jgi:transposase-like protein
MGLKRREFTREFKLSVIREMDAGKSLAQVARKYQLDPSLTCKWRKLYQRHKDEAFAGRGRVPEYETQSEARASISKFIEKVYNQKRLRSALGYLPPAEFEQALALKTVS